jgi:hypothetical protein
MGEERKLTAQATERWAGVYVFLSVLSLGQILVAPSDGERLEFPQTGLSCAPLSSWQGSAHKIYIFRWMNPGP